VCGVAVSS